MLYLAITVESLRGLRLLGLKNIRLQGDLTTAFNLLWGLVKETERKILLGPVVAEQRAVVSNWKKRLWLDIKKKFFTMKMMRHEVQWGSGCPIIFQGQVGWDVEKPGQVEVFLVYARGLELADLQGSLPVRTILWFYQFI